MNIKRRTPRNVDEVLTNELLFRFEDRNDAADTFADILINEGWEIVVCDNRRGYANYSEKLIVIPKWSRIGLQGFQEGYYHYYLAHELAHALAIRKHGDKIQSHGPEFMNAFKSLCDSKYWHYELEYKPQTASAAGIVFIAEDF